MDLKEREIRRCWNVAMSVDDTAKHMTLQPRCRLEDPIEARELVAERFAIYERHLGDKGFPAYCLMGGYFSDKSGVVAKEIGVRDVNESLPSRNDSKLRDMLAEARVTEVRPAPAPVPERLKRAVEAAQRSQLVFQQ